jgi:hypothetical protein
MKANLKRGQQHPLKASLDSIRYFQSGPGRSCFFFNETEQPGSVDHLKTEARDQWSEVKQELR